jgi:hypothetical protein
MFSEEQEGEQRHKAIARHKKAHVPPAEHEERVRRIEPPPTAWEAVVLPLNYTRLMLATWIVATCRSQIPECVVCEVCNNLA